MKKQQDGFAHIALFSMLLVMIGVMTVSAIGVYRNVSTDQRETVEIQTDSDSEDALQARLQAGTDQTAQQSASQAVSAPAAPTPQTATEVATKVVGNTNPSVKPALPEAVPEPTTSIEGLATFFNAVQTGDFVTANALLGPSLAADIGSIAGTSDASLALSECKKDAICNLVLTSFSPPTSGYEVTKYTSSTGLEGEQISFLLSQSSPTVTSVLGDANVDVFMESYQGVWVVADVYVDGESLSAFVSS